MTSRGAQRGQHLGSSGAGFSKLRLIAWILAGLAVLFVGTTIFFSWMSTPGFWESEIKSFEQADQTHPPRSGVIVFTGSSSIRKWATLSADMAPLEVIDRGFGGSTISQVNYFARRIVNKYHPRAVVLYAGDNDLAFPWHKTPEAVLNDLEQFVRIVHSELPETWIYFISLKPAPATAGDWPAFDRANHMIAAYLQTQDRTQYIDVSTTMLDPQGRPRSDLYDSDPRHMNPRGYALWTSIVRPVLLMRFGPARQ